MLLFLNQIGKGLMTHTIERELKKQNPWSWQAYKLV
jgi:hypothetical protein